METAEEFAARLMTHLADTLIVPRMSPREAKSHAIALIEEDRAAAKRELLEEIRSRSIVLRNGPSKYIETDSVWEAFVDAAAKYTQPGGVK